MGNQSVGGRFPGFDKTPVDFQSVRDGSRAQLFYLDIDLSIARTLTGGGANGPILTTFGGNLFYIDQDPSFAGNASVYIQPRQFTGRPTPIYAGPGFLSRMAYTECLITNIAQPGKTLRIIYGTDADFDPKLAGIQNVNIVSGGAASSVHGNYAIGVGLVSSILLGSAATRKYLLIQNPTGSPIWIQTNSAPAVVGPPAIQIGPGQNYEPTSVPVNQVSAISLVAGLIISVTEGQ